MQSPTAPTAYEDPTKAHPEQNLAHPEQAKNTVLHKKCVTGVQQNASVGGHSDQGNAHKATGEEADAVAAWQALTPELRDVVRALPRLPEAVKAGIVAMVKSCVAGKVACR